MELRHLRYFVAVAEELHFGRAARRLHISQPPLSAQIKDLESELGGPLFIRGHHKVELTDSGKALLGRARELLAQVNAIAAETASVARGERGLVTIGYTTTAAYQLISRLVRNLRQSNANISLRLVEMASPLQPGALADQRIDLGIACLPVSAPDLVSRTLVHERMVVAIPRGHALAKVSRVRLADLAGVAQVGLRNSTEPGWATAFARELVRGRVHGPVVAEADTKLALLGLVEAGVGVGLISSSLATLGRRGVVFRPIADSRLTLVLGALHRPDPQPLVNAVLTVAIAAGSAVEAEH